METIKKIPKNKFVCIQCKKVRKLEDQFDPKNGGKYNICKKCRLSYYRQWKQNNMDRYNDKYYHRKKKDDEFQCQCGLYTNATHVKKHMLCKAHIKRMNYKYLKDLNLNAQKNQ